MPTPRKVRFVAIYARLSVTTEESVSIERQIEAARKYAAARGWSVVLVDFDDGVSATKTKPHERPGWRRIVESSEAYDAVIVWKVDRLARRVLDFLRADEALQGRGAGLVAVEDPVDMTTAQGRAFATMLAVFAEMEAAAISARVTAARRALLAAGRRGGGRPPFGYMNVPNPAGPGFVLARDPERIAVTASLAERALAGATLYSLRKSLETDGVLPRARAKRRSSDAWHDASVEAILRNPVLAGMTPDRGDVLRDADGLPIVDEELALLTTAEWRRLVALLDEAKRPGVRARGAAPALLFGLLLCASCEGRMYRCTAAGLPGYRCERRGCTRRVHVNRPAVEAHVVGRFLAEVGHLPVVELRAVELDAESLALADVEAAIKDTLAAMALDDADIPALTERLAALKAKRSAARAVEAKPTQEAHATGRTFAEAWAALDEGDVVGRRDLLMHGLEAVLVAPAARRGGSTFDEDRVELIWRERGEDYDAP